MEVRRKTKALERSANNVLSGKMPIKSSSDHPIEFRSRSNLAGLTTKLLRFGTNSERGERRKLLEEEKVLHLRAALVMSMTRKGGAPQLHPTRVERDEKEKEDQREKEHVELSKENKHHHWELSTEEYRRNVEASTEKRKQVHDTHEEEMKDGHSHNVSNVVPFRAPHPLVPNTCELADKAIAEAVVTSSRNSMVTTLGSRSGEREREREKGVGQRSPAIALGDLKAGLKGLKKAASTPAPKLQLGDLKTGLAGLKKVRVRSPTGTEKEEEHVKMDLILEERQKAWTRFEADIRSSVSRHQILQEMPPLTSGVEQGIKLGDGKFGVAYRYHFAMECYGTVVLKIASFGQNNPHQDTSPGRIISRAEISDEARKLAPVALLDEFRREVLCLQELQHHNLLTFRAVLLPPAPLSLMMEFMAGGSLGRAMTNASWTAQIVPQKQRMELLKGILRGLNFMHSRGFVHRDIKAHNILLCGRSSSLESGKVGGGSVGDLWRVAKIADFGTAVKVPEEHTGQKLTGEVGTSGYTAPEIVSPEGYGASVDVFAFAVVIWEMFRTNSTTKNPMIGADLARLEEDCRPDFDSGHPSSVVVLARRGWQQDPSKRPSLSAICGLLGVEDKIK